MREGSPVEGVSKVSEVELRIEGEFIEIWDTRRMKWHKAGRIAKDGDERIYISRHREILHKWNSLGVSESILRFIDNYNIERVQFILGKQKPYKLWEGRTRDFLNHGRPLFARNEKGCTLHQELEHLRFVGRISPSLR